MARYGDITPQTDAERIYTVVVFMIGTLIYATIFGSVAVLLQNFDRAGSRYRERMEAVAEFVNFFGIPAEFHQRIADHVDHLWQRHGGMDVSTAIGDLPDALRTEVLMHQHGAMIRELKVFYHCEEGFLRSIIMRLRPQVCLPGECIIEENDPATKMFLLRKGKLHVGTANRKHVYAVHVDNSIVGELPLIAGTSTQTASVWAADFCDLYFLERGHFQSCCKLFPKSLEVMKRNVGIDDARHRAGGSSDARTARLSQVERRDRRVTDDAERDSESRSTQHCPSLVQTEENTPRDLETRIQLLEQDNKRTQESLDLILSRLESIHTLCSQSQLAW